MFTPSVMTLPIRTSLSTWKWKADGGAVVVWLLVMQNIKSLHVEGMCTLSSQVRFLQSIEAFPKGDTIKLFLTLAMRIVNIHAWSNE